MFESSEEASICSLSDILKVQRPWLYPQQIRPEAKFDDDLNSFAVWYCFG
jgi:hypothetical protein